MLKFRTPIFFTLFLFLFNSSVFANSYLKPEDLDNIQYGCFVKEKEIVFCSEKDISNPDVVVRLPLLKPIVLSNGKRAFRVMATIENNTKHNLYGARVKIYFNKNEENFLDILISEKIIYKGTSSTNRSHLIRSDVAANIPIYNALNEIYLSADTSSINIRLYELIFG